MRKHLPDVNQIAAATANRATTEHEKNPYAVALARQRAAKLSPQRRREIAMKAAATRWKAAKKK